MQVKITRMCLFRWLALTHGHEKWVSYPFFYTFLSNNSATGARIKWSIIHYNLDTLTNWGQNMTIQGWTGKKTQTRKNFYDRLKYGYFLTSL